jgi:HEAT repeat protein
VRFDDLKVTGELPPAAPQLQATPQQAEALKSLDANRALELARSGEAGLPLLNLGLVQGGRRTALCAWALWQHPNPNAAPYLRPLLWKVDQVAGYYAAQALGRMPGAENVEALAALLPQERLGFWELSADGTGRLTDVFNRGQRMAAPTEEWMPNLRVAYASMEALGDLGGARAGETLLRALRNDQYLIRYGAARALGRMRHAAAGPLLEELALNDPVLMVRSSAQAALRRLRGESEPAAPAPPELPPAIAFLKTKNRSESNLGFRDSYFFPKTPRYHSGENLYTLTPPRPDGVLRNLTQLTNGAVQGAEVSWDGRRILFAMRRNEQTDGFHLFEIGADGTGLRQLTSGNCNDVDPNYLPDGRIVFCSDRAGYQEYYHQERSRVIYVMNSDGSDLQQITFNPNQDYDPLPLRDGRVLYSSYRFYAQDGHEGPLPGERLGLSRIETVLRSANPDGTADQLFYGSMRGSFYSPLRPMPFSDQWAGWHPRGYHVGVSISQPREMPDGRILCVTPAGLTLVDPRRAPVDCELPVFPEVVNLAGGEEVYIHNYDDMNPVGRYTSPHPINDGWALVSHAPWHDLRGNGYGLYLLNLVTRELTLVYDDPQMSEVDPLPLAAKPVSLARAGNTNPKRAETGLIYCNSVFNTDLPVDRSKIKFVRVLEGVQMGLSIAANAAFRTRLLGTVPIHPDGSFYVEVPADTPIRFELLDAGGRMLVHETEFNYVRGEETKGCAGCHESRQQSSINLRPAAMADPPVPALRQRGDLIYMGQPGRPYNRIYRE